MTSGTASRSRKAEILTFLCQPRTRSPGQHAVLQDVAVSGSEYCQFWLITEHFATNRAA